MYGITVNINVHAFHASARTVYINCFQLDMALRSSFVVWIYLKSEHTLKKIMIPVSYTHLDVYKRQTQFSETNNVSNEFVEYLNKRKCCFPHRMYDRNKS